MKYFWFSKTHSKAFDTLKKAAWSDSNFLILSGDSGVGKTTLIKYLKKELLPEYISIEIGNEFQDAKELFMLIASHTGINKNFVSKGAFFIHFNRYLHNLQAEKKKILLILDDFYSINDNLIKELKFLSNITIRHQKIIKILISGENISFSTIEPDKPTNSSLVACRLERLNRSETNSYIDYMLGVVGIRSSIFPQETVQKIFSYSRGILREINKVCDCALNFKNKQKLNTIAPVIIEQCCEELNLLGRGQANNYENIPQKIEPTKDLFDNFCNGFASWKLFDQLKNFTDINKQWAIDEFTKAVEKSHSFIQSAAKNFYLKQLNNWHTKISNLRLFDSYLWNSLLSVSLVALAFTFAIWYQGIFPFKPDAPKYNNFQKKTYSPEMDQENFHDKKIIKSLEQLNIRAKKQLNTDQKLSGVNRQKQFKSKFTVNQSRSIKVNYFVQVGAFLIKENAIKTVRKLINKGYLAKIVIFTDSKNQIWHTVRIGEYSSLKAAKKHATEFSNQEKMDSIVIPLRQQ
jgi:type II secretory pathway predicted ATPase ExeA